MFKFIRYIGLIGLTLLLSSCSIVGVEYIECMERLGEGHTLKEANKYCRRFK